jgi:hypothetical protein
MNIMKTQSPERRSIFRRIVMGLVLAAVVGGIAAPASAESWRERRDRERHEHWVHEHRAHGYYAAPAPVYAPPPVVYAPPPGPPALNFVFPLRFH